MVTLAAILVLSLVSLTLIPGAKNTSRMRLPARRGTRHTSPMAPSIGPPNRRGKRMKTNLSLAHRKQLGHLATARMETRKRAKPQRLVQKRRRRKRAKSIGDDREADLRTGIRGRGVLHGIGGGKKEGRTATMTATTASRALPSATERPSLKLTDTF